MDLLHDEATALELIDLQIRLEYQLAADGRLIPFAGSQEQARYITYRYASGYVRWYPHDLPENLVTRLNGTPAAWAFEQPGRIQEILDSQTPRQDSEAPRPKPRL